MAPFVKFSLASIPHYDSTVQYSLPLVNTTQVTLPVDTPLHTLPPVDTP